MNQVQKQIIGQRARVLAFQARKNHLVACVARNWLGLARAKALREKEFNLVKKIDHYIDFILN